MLILLWIIIAVFLIGVVLCSILRLQEDGSRAEIFGGKAYETTVIFAFVIGLLAAIWVIILSKGADSPQARYFINGAVFEGGTNWVVVGGAFMVCAALSILLINSISFLPMIIFSPNLSIESKLATLSIYAGVISIPILIYIADRLEIKALPFFSAFCAVPAIFCTISTVIRKKKKLPIYKRALVGFGFSALYLVAVIRLISVYS